MCCAARLGALALLLVPCVAAAQAVVRVRARSHLELSQQGRQVAEGGQRVGVRVQLRLLDGASGAPLAAQPVLLQLDRVPARLLRTDEGGTATADLLGLSLGEHRVRARYAGDALRDPAVASLRLDLSRRDVALGLSVPERASLGEELAIGVELRDGDTPLPGPVVLRVAGQPVPLELRMGHGTALVRLDPRRLPGLRGGARLLVEATFAGDALHDPAAARRELMLTTRIRVLLEPPAPAEIPPWATLLLRGSAHDEDGPVSGEPVEVRAALRAPHPGGEVVLGRSVLDAGGRFVVAVPQLSLPPGPAQLVAVVQPLGGHRLGGRSVAVPIQVVPPLPLRFFVAPLALTALLLLGRLGLRHIQVLRNALGRLRRPALAPGAEPLPGVTLPPRRRIQSVLRRPDHVVAGAVYDAASGGPVAAEVAVESAPPVRCDAQGRFALAMLPPGRYPIEVRAAGYLPERFTVDIPHFGELRAVQVALLPIRTRIMAAWRQVAAPLLPPAAELATWTPRELLRHAQDRDPFLPLLPVLGRLTELVEEAYYSGRLPNGDMLHAVERLCAQVRDMAPIAPQPSPPSDRPAAPRSSL